MLTTGIYFVDVLWLYAPLILVIERTHSNTCPVNGHIYNTLNYCYWVNTIAMTFDGANEDCKLKGGRLAKVPDDGAKQFIEDNLGTTIGISSGWIGVKTDDYINFTTVSGELVTYLPWKTSYTYNGQCILLATETSPFMYEETLCESYHISVCYMEITGTASKTTTLINDSTTQTTSTTQQSTEVETTELTSSVETTTDIIKTVDITTDQTTAMESTTELTTTVDISTNQKTTIIDTTELTSTVEITTKQQKTTVDTTLERTTVFDSRLITTPVETTVVTETTVGTQTTATTDEATTESTSTTIPTTLLSATQPSTDYMYSSDIPTSYISTDTTKTSPLTATQKENDSCLCVCYGSTNITEDALQRRLQEIVNILTVPKKTTSASIRKLISAPDDRVSARGIGYVGAAILVTVFGIIMLTDITNILAERKHSSTEKNF